MNPMLQKLNQNPMQMLNMVRNAGNPQAMLNQMVQTNPQMKQVIDLINANGGDPKSTFYKMAEQKGIDPNSILNRLR